MAAVPDQFCTKCGRSRVTDDRFCGSCGTKLQE
ncbi:MAG: zinc-ribbon domain-containing protein [Thermomicrobiales bacterium]